MLENIHPFYGKKLAATDGEIGLTKADIERTAKNEVAEAGAGMKSMDEKSGDAHKHN